MRVTIVAVVEVGGETGNPDALHAWAHDALTSAGADPVFVVAREGSTVHAIDCDLDEDCTCGAADRHACPFCTEPVPMVHHIPHSTPSIEWETT